MWLLNTGNAELKFFAGPEDVPHPGYAILSHVWLTDTMEDTFQGVRTFGEQCKANAMYAAASREELSLNLPQTPDGSSMWEARQQIRSDAKSGSAGLPRSSRGPSSLSAFIINEGRASAYTTIPLPTNPRDLVSPKIRGFLTLAEKDGYEWCVSCDSADLRGITHPIACQHRHRHSVPPSAHSRL